MSEDKFYRHPTLAALGAALRDGRTSSRTLVDEVLVRIADPAGEGKRAFLRVYAEQARAAAEAQDRLRAVGSYAMHRRRNTTRRSWRGCAPPAPSSSARPT